MVWLSFVYKVTKTTYNFVSFIVKVILLELASSLSAPAPDKTQWFVHLSFNSTLHLINGILSDPQKLLGYFNSMTIVVFLKIPFTSSVTVFYNNLALCLKN